MWSFNLNKIFKTQKNSGTLWFATKSDDYIQIWVALTRPKRDFNWFGILICCPRRRERISGLWETFARMGGSRLRTLLLILLVVQTSATVLLLRYSRSSILRFKQQSVFIRNFFFTGQPVEVSCIFQQQWFSSLRSGSTCSAWPCWPCRRDRWGCWGSSRARWWRSQGRRCSLHFLPPFMSCRTTCSSWLWPTLMQAPTRYYLQHRFT